MSYSEHMDLQLLCARIDEYTCSISDLLFTGSGLNDITVGGIITALRPLRFRLEITENGTDFDYFKWSKNGGRAWHATNVPIGSADTYIELDEGVKVKFTYAGGLNVKQHTVRDYWEWTANPVHSAEERRMAYDWVNDRLRSKMSTPVGSPSNVVVLAEANYACYVILRANGDPDAPMFRTEADSLISQYIKNELEAGTQSGPSTNSSDIMPVFTRGKKDWDRVTVGETMGRRSGYAGNLDDW